MIVCAWARGVDTPHLLVPAQVSLAHPSWGLTLSGHRRAADLRECLPLGALASWSAGHASRQPRPRDQAPGDRLRRRWASEAGALERTLIDRALLICIKTTQMVGY